MPDFPFNLGDYRVTGQIGNGGMGCVYAAVNQRGEKIALKMMSNRIAFQSEYRRIFEYEAHVLSRMNHPNVVRIAGEPFKDSSGNLYLPMDYVEGSTIEQCVQSHGPFSEAEAVELMIKVLEAIAVVHDSGFIHRDIKPSNIMIRSDHSVCIIDFGIAKDARVNASGRTVGTIIGTDGYMSPEQAKGLNIDLRTDIYSLGCVLYYMLTGRHAVQNGADRHETTMNILREGYQSPSSVVPGITSHIDRVFLKAANKDMTKRYQSARAFARALGGNGEVDVGIYTPIVTVGRSSDNDIVMSDASVSRHHLTLRGRQIADASGRNTYSIEIEDHSTCGTGVNGTFLNKGRQNLLYDGTAALPDVLLCGRADFRLDWKQVVDLLKERGWQSGQTEVLPPPPPPPSLPLPKSENIDTVIGVLCFIFPLVGFICSGIWLGAQPRKSRQAALLGFLGFVTEFTLMALVAIIS